MQQQPKLIPRALTPSVQRALEVFPVVVIVGPRQVGKSTLVQEGPIGHDRLYLTLDDIDLLGEARREPEQLLGRSGRLTIDEVQRAPELLLAMKRDVDRRRVPGRFLVTGSADIRALSTVADHLPGRAVYLSLEPLGVGERHGRPTGEALATLLKAPSAAAARDALAPERRSRVDLEDSIVRGGLPIPALLEEDDARDLWYASYARSWLERGLADVANVADLSDLKRIMEMAGARTGQLLNQAEIGRDAGLPRTTAHRYLSLLSIGLLLTPLPAFSRNPSQRLIKTPKLYWRDTGLAAHLAGIRSRAGLRDHPLFGALVENLVLCNLRAWGAKERNLPDLHYWRTAGGMETDLVVEWEGHSLPIEVKASRRLRTDDLHHMRAFLEQHRRWSRFGVVLYGGESVQTPAPNVVAVPFDHIL